MKLTNLKKKKLSLENEGILVDLLVLESKGNINGFAIEGDFDVKTDKDEVNLENGTTIDPFVLIKSNGIAQDVNIMVMLAKNTWEGEQVVKSTDVYDANKIKILADVINTDDWLPNVSKRTHRGF
ncbi:unnamed protein product [Lactuca virosa]|uniref:Uncharacterized protein n=1 Tax=Lactuca virosa TaxID=75947 RepID=A0AAU9LPE3_9ASTR|nr:unnamed protein product [Lactuca virosa]